MVMKSENADEIAKYERERVRGKERREGGREGRKEGRNLHVLLLNVFFLTKSH